MDDSVEVVLAAWRDDPTLRMSCHLDGASLERSKAKVAVAAIEAAAFRRGAEAMREAAAASAEAFPARTHGALATAPYAAAEQAADEIAAALRALAIPEEPAMRWQPIETAPRD
jgi:hypothetical protein